MFPLPPLFKAWVFLSLPYYVFLIDTIQDILCWKGRGNFRFLYDLVPWNSDHIFPKK